MPYHTIPCASPDTAAVVWHVYTSSNQRHLDNTVDYAELPRRCCHASHLMQEVATSLAVEGAVEAEVSAVTPLYLVHKQTESWGNSSRWQLGMVASLMQC